MASRSRTPLPATTIAYDGNSVAMLRARRHIARRRASCAAARSIIRCARPCRRSRAYHARSVRAARRVRAGINNPAADRPRWSGSSPERTRRMLSATSRAACSGTVMLARCGVISTFSMPQNGMSCGSGSTVKASSVASAIWPGLQRVDQRRLVDDRAARRIDQLGASRHQRELARTDEAARLRRQRQQDDEDFGLRQKRVERVTPGACIARPRSSSGVRLQPRTSKPDVRQAPAPPAAPSSPRPQHADLDVRQRAADECSAIRRGAARARRSGYRAHSA